MKTKNNIFVKDFKNGVVTLHLPLGEDLLKSCERLFFDVLSKDFKKQLKDSFNTNHEFKTIYFETNGVIVNIDIDELPAKSSKCIYFAWLREYFKLQASLIELPNFELTAKEIINFDLNLKDIPDEDYIVKYNPYKLFVFTLIAKLYQHLLDKDMEDGDTTYKTRQLYNFFENDINYSFEIIMKEIKLYI